MNLKRRRTRRGTGVYLHAATCGLPSPLRGSCTRRVRLCRALALGQAWYCVRNVRTYIFWSPRGHQTLCFTATDPPKKLAEFACISAAAKRRHTTSRSVWKGRRQGWQAEAEAEAEADDKIKLPKQKRKKKKKKKRVVSSTQGSQLVPLASTNRARHSLTSAFE